MWLRCPRSHIVIVPPREMAEWRPLILMSHFSSLEIISGSFCDTLFIVTSGRAPSVTYLELTLTIVYNLSAYCWINLQVKCKTESGFFRFETSGKGWHNLSLTACLASGHVYRLRLTTLRNVIMTNAAYTEIAEASCLGHVTGGVLFFVSTGTGRSGSK